MFVCSRIWIREDTKSYLGAGRVELLERIAESGSISKAAKQMKMSYKAAWDSVDIMNKISHPNELVLSNAGGGKNSGTQLTSEGKKAIEVFKNLQTLKEEFFENFKDCKDFDELNVRIEAMRGKIKG